MGSGQWADPDGTPSKVVARATTAVGRRTRSVAVTSKGACRSKSSRRAKRLAAEPAEKDCHFRIHTSSIHV